MRSRNKHALESVGIQQQIFLLNSQHFLLNIFSSIVSVVTEPGNIGDSAHDYPSTSRSIDGRRHLRTETVGAVRRRPMRRARRVNSESDVRKLRR